MGISIKIVNNMAKFGREFDKENRQKMIDACTLVRDAAVKKVMQHQSAGRTYVRGGIAHTASLPGYPPNADTGQLHQSIAYSVSDKGHVGHVGTNATHAMPLEMGTSKMAPRPFLQPAFNDSLPGLEAIFGRPMKGL